MNDIMKHYIKNLKNMPIALSGLALGILGLGNILANELHAYFKIIAIMIAIGFLLILISKKIFHFTVFKDELKHVVIGSFVPTFTMCLMLLANIIATEYLLLGKILWCYAIILHIIIVVIFFYYRAINFNFNHILPSWFIPIVGIAVAPLSVTNIGMLTVAHIIFYIALGGYFIVLPIMLYRLIFGAVVLDNQLPSFAVMAAPPNLCLAAYLTAFSDINPVIVNILLPLAIMMTCLVYIFIIRINHFKIKFIPIYASFTFPLSIGATAIIKYAYYLGLNTTYGKLWYMIGVIELIIASIAIIWVLYKMTQFVIIQLRTQ